MNLASVLFLGLVFAVSSFSNGYQMRMKHGPWWSSNQHHHQNEIGGGNNYQYYMPFYDHRAAQDRFLFDKDYQNMNFYKRMPKIKRKPTRRNRWMPTKSSSNFMDREWPDWIPPVRMIKLPLDTPPE